MSDFAILRKRSSIKSFRKNTFGAFNEFIPASYVGSGSKPVLTAPKHQFRSTLINGHYRTGPVGPVRAIPGQLDGGRGGLPSLVRGPFDCAAIFAVRHHAV